MKLLRMSKTYFRKERRMPMPGLKPSSQTWPCYEGTKAPANRSFTSIGATLESGLLYFLITLSVQKYELGIHEVSGPAFMKGSTPSKEKGLCKGPEVGRLALPFLNYSLAIGWVSKSQGSYFTLTSKIQSFFEITFISKQKHSKIP